MRDYCNLQINLTQYFYLKRQFLFNINVIFMFYQYAEEE